MLITKRKYGIFKIANIYFAESSHINAVPDCDVITYHTYEDWGEIKGFERRKCFKATIDLSQSIDEIWKKINRQHKRHIRRSEKNGIEVFISNNYKEFYELYKKFQTEKNFNVLFKLDLLSSKFMKKYGILFIAEKNGETISGNLYFHDENNAILACSVYQIMQNTIENKKASIDSNCSIQWEAMKYFKNLGIINYDLGNLGCEDINSNRQISGGDYFKRCFGVVINSENEYRKFNSHFVKLLFNSGNLLLKWR